MFSFSSLQTVITWRRSLVHFLVPTISLWSIHVLPVFFLQVLMFPPTVKKHDVGKWWTVDLAIVGSLCTDVVPMLVLALCFVWNHSFYFHHQRTGCGPENWVPEQHNFFAGLHQRYQLLHSLGAGLLSQIKTTSLLFSFPLHQRTQDMVKQQLKKQKTTTETKKRTVLETATVAEEKSILMSQSWSCRCILVMSMYIET